MVEPRSYCIDDICVSVCMSVYVCPSAMTLEWDNIANPNALQWHNIVNSQYIAIQFYRRVDIPRRYVGIEI